nr:RNA-directed DNA polymerase, eukaryota, reverse transcriptase zinc-binding domain protein [Tanacetum cinerariifolium]
MNSDAAQKLPRVIIPTRLQWGLLFKWLWRFYSKDSSLWAKVIMAIHGSDGKVEASMKAGTRSCWLNILHEVNVLSKKEIDLKKFMWFKVGNGDYIMFWEDTWNEGGKFKCRFPRMYALESMKAGTRSCWLNILHEVNVLSIKGIDLKKFMRFKVGNGENIMFWEDTWNEGGKFKCRFPRMYALESCKSITVGRKLAQSSLINSFRRSPRGGAEQQQYNDLEDMVTATILAPMSDKLVWSLESSGEFTVASVRKLIDDKWLLGAENKTR